MQMRILSFVSLLALVLAASGPVAAQNVAPGKTLVLVPYAEPGNKDPHAAGVTASIASELPAQGITVVTAASMDHLDAVASAGALCKQDSATGLLIPEARYAQIPRTVGYHFQVRLDLVDCGGNVVWSTIQTSDYRTSLAQAMRAIDNGFHDVFQTAVTHLAEAPALAPAATFTAPPAAPITTGTPVYALVPMEQPGIADPTAPSMTQPIATTMTARNLAFKTLAPVDHLTAIASAANWCTADAATAIVVPSLFVDATAGMGALFGGGVKATATVQLDVLNCQGRILTHALGSADGTVKNMQQDLIDLIGKAAGPALDQVTATARS